MKESVAIAKEADVKKGFSPTKSSDNSIPRLRDEPEMQLGSLSGVIGNITRNGGTPSVESIATELSGVHATQRAPALLALQQTHGNRYVQRVVAGIQAKLVVGQPGDIYEQEADRVAEEVMRMPEPKVQRQLEEEEKEEILRTKRDSNHTQEVTPDLESRIYSIRGGGQPLSESERTFFEPRFRYDFSQVRVHTDVQSADIARALNGRAFTVGHDIVFGTGQYAPGTTKGRNLLAHELTHTLQQRHSVGARLLLRVIPSHDMSEREADRVADNVMAESYTNVQISLSTPAIQRATLTYSTVAPKTKLGCGGFSWGIRWGLSGATASTNGFVVQKLTFDLMRERCAGGRNDFYKTYWEAWQVRGGNIFVGTSTTPHRADTFRVTPTPDQKGNNFEGGKAKYIDGYTAPSTWGRVPEAGSLPATTTGPDGWSDAGTIDRMIGISFDCCEQSDMGRWTSQREFPTI